MPRVGTYQCKAMIMEVVRGRCIYKNLSTITPWKRLGRLNDDWWHLQIYYLYITYVCSTICLIFFLGNIAFAQQDDGATYDELACKVQLRRTLFQHRVQVQFIATKGAQNLAFALFNWKQGRRTRGRRGNIWRRGEATKYWKGARPCASSSAATRALLLLPNVCAVSFGVLVYSRQQKAPAALLITP